MKRGQYGTVVKPRLRDVFPGMELWFLALNVCVALSKVFNLICLSHLLYELDNIILPHRIAKT